MKKIIFFILTFFFLYLGIFTWNLKTGIIDRFITYTGMEVVGWVLYPGNWAYQNITNFWNNYIFLVNVKKQNKQLKKEIKELKLKIIQLEKDKREARRLRKLLKFSPPKKWKFQGARILSQSIGPNGIVKTLMIDKGVKDGIKKDTPVVIEKGVVGRVIKTGYNFSIVLLVNDLNSRIPVVSVHTRTKGIAKGTKSGELEVLYIDQSAPLSKKEIFVTSGLANVFPKGLPVAKIVDIKSVKDSLFKKVKAVPMVDVAKLEEVLLLTKNTE